MRETESAPLAVSRKHRGWLRWTANDGRRFGPVMDHCHIRITCISDNNDNDDGGDDSHKSDNRHYSGEDID